MAFFVKTDTDEALLQSLEKATQLEQGTPGCLDEFHIGNLSHGLALNGNNAVEPQATMYDSLEKNLTGEMQETRHFSMKARCDVHNTINSYNRGLAIEKETPIGAMDKITEQGLDSSLMLLLMLGHPLDASN